MQSLWQWDFAVHPLLLHLSLAGSTELGLGVVRLKPHGCPPTDLPHGCPPTDLLFLAWSHLFTTVSTPNCTISWGPNVQIHEPTGESPTQTVILGTRDSGSLPLGRPLRMPTLSNLVKEAGHLHCPCCAPPGSLVPTVLTDCL